MNADAPLDEFRLPPVVSRIVQFEIDIAQQEFDQKAIKWLHGIAQDGNYPDRRMRQAWEIELQIKAAATPPRIQLTLVPQIHRKSDDGKPGGMIELAPPTKSEPSVLTVTQTRSDEKPTRYQTLKDETQERLPSLLETFGVQKIRGLRLEYCNKITKTRYPGYWDEKGSLQLGKLLRLFATHAMGKMSYITPLHIEFSQAGPEGHPGSALHTIIRTEGESKRDFQLVVRLAFSSRGLAEGRSLESVWKEMDAAHSLISEEFRRHFTEQALKEFAHGRHHT